MLSSVRLYWNTFQPVSSAMGLHAPASHPFGQRRRFHALPVARHISAVDPLHCFAPGVHCTAPSSPASTTAVPSVDPSEAPAASIRSTPAAPSAPPAASGASASPGVARLPPHATPASTPPARG